jgi:hypothetical protein
LPDGNYEIVVSYVGYSIFKQKVEIKGKNVVLNVDLETVLELDEVNVVADVARARETLLLFQLSAPKTGRNNCSP